MNHSSPTADEMSQASTSQTQGTQTTRFCRFHYVRNKVNPEFTIYSSKILQHSKFARLVKTVGVCLVTNLRLRRMMMRPKEKGAVENLRFLG